MTITHLAVDHHRIPLPVVLSDSTHGDIAEFELVTVRLRDAAGAEGVGYTYTVGRGGAAVTALIERDLRPLVVGAALRRPWRLCEPRDLGCRHRAVGSEGAPDRDAALAPARGP